MVENLYTEINDRSKLIFKKLVESYLRTGSPAGSETIMKMGGFNLSSASIRSILSNLQKEGLLYAPHRSAGRMPTEKGMRFFVDGLLEFGRISKTDKENIKQQCSTRGKSYEEVLDIASKAISGLSNYAGIVIAPNGFSMEANGRFEYVIVFATFPKDISKMVVTTKIKTKLGDKVYHREDEEEVCIDELWWLAGGRFFNGKWKDAIIIEAKVVIETLYDLDGNEVSKEKWANHNIII